jgi:hypothetical protein
MRTAVIVLALLAVLAGDGSTARGADNQSGAPQSSASKDRGSETTWTSPSGCG